MIRLYFVPISETFYKTQILIFNLIQTKTSTKNDTMLKFTLTIVLLFTSTCVGFTQSARQYTRNQTEAKAIVERVLKAAPVIDGHNDLFIHYIWCETCPRSFKEYRLDTINSGHTDIPRLRKGGSGGLLMNVYGEEKGKNSYLVAWDILFQMAKEYAKDMKIVRSSAEMRAAIKTEKIALLPTLEGAERLENSVAYLRVFYKLGLRSVTFAYHTNGLADGSDDTAKHNGISEAGKTMLKEMNRLGVIVDLSHVSTKAMNDILDHTKAPVIFSHSNARALCNVNRNIPDEVLLRLKNNGGLIMLTFVPYFTTSKHADWLRIGDSVYFKAKSEYPKRKEKLDNIMANWNRENPEPVVTVADMADHFDHVKKLIGVDHIGIAGDFDGIHFVIKDLHDTSTYPVLLTELARRGWSETELRKITSENFLRVFEEVEKSSQN